MLGCERVAGGQAEAVREAPAPPARLQLEETYERIGLRGTLHVREDDELVAARPEAAPAIPEDPLDTIGGRAYELVSRRHPRSSPAAAGRNARDCRNSGPISPSLLAPSRADAQCDSARPR